MKKIISSLFFLSLILLGSNTLVAQQTNLLGVRAGWQYSGIFIDNKDQLFDSHHAFYVGVFRDDRIVPMLFWGKGIEYMQTGLRIDDDNRRVFHYLSVPVYIKGKLGPVFALTGLAANFRVGDNIFVNGEKMKPDSDEKINGFDLPVYAGLGVTILRFTIEARYHWGLIAIDSDPDSFNQYFQLGAAVNF